MPLKLEVSINEFGYQLIANRPPISGGRHEVVTTRVRNELIAWASDTMPTTAGKIWKIASKSLGGGIWEVWAEPLAC